MFYQGILSFVLLLFKNSRKYFLLKQPANFLLFYASQLEFTSLKSTMEICEICSKLTIETPGRYRWRVLVSLLLTLNCFLTFYWCFHSWLWTSKYQVITFWKKNHLHRVNTSCLEIFETLVIVFFFFRKQCYKICHFYRNSELSQNSKTLRTMQVCNFCLF